MGTLLTLSYVVHVLSGALWTGAVCFVAYVLVGKPAARLDREALNLTYDRLLRVTRWTGIALPVTGAYQLWRLYPHSVDALVASSRGQLVVAMLALWGLLNGLLELGIYRVRTVSGPVSTLGYLLEGFLVDGGVTDVPAERLVAVGRPYVLAGVVLAIALLVDAALLAAGTP